MKKKIFLLITVLIGLVLTPVLSVVNADDTFDAKAKAAIAIDSDSGKILYAKNADTPMGLLPSRKLLQSI